MKPVGHQRTSYPLALLIGLVAGLRALAAPAAVAETVHLGWLDLTGAWLVGGAALIGIAGR
jgi:uncharacterized membrane protein